MENRLEYVALVVGSIGMAGGEFFGIARGFNLGVFVAGLRVAIADPGTVIPLKSVAKSG